MTLAAVLWDLDGTLIDSEPIHIAALADVLAQAGLVIPPDLHAWLVGLSARQVHDVLFDRLGLALSYEALIEQKYAAYRRRKSDLRPRDGSMEIFQSLARRSIQQAIVSNSDRVLVDLNLDAIGLAIPDMVSVSRNDVRCGKPDAEPYLRAAWLLRATPSECVVVEDSAVGAAAGLAAGMRVIVWPHPSDKESSVFPCAVQQIGSARALAKLLDRAAAQPVKVSA